MSKWKLVFLLIAVCLSMPFWANAQNGKLNSIDFKTPNAASLGRVEQVPVSAFNGLPQISIPIYNFSYKDIAVPINMSYHASGNRTDDMPGWVGLGWTINAGGAVTRVVNGLPDEIETSLLNNQGQYTYTGEQGNFFRSSYFAGADWTSSNTLTGYLNTVNLMVGMQPFDAEPDEFLFNAGDFSGSFYFYRNQANDLQVKVKCQSGEFIDVVPSFITEKDTAIFVENTSVTHRPIIKIKRSFNKFVISRSNGYKYEFGGNLSAMDLTTSFSGGLKTMANSWYLTKIISPTNQIVSFSYEKRGHLMVQKKSKTLFCRLTNPPDQFNNCVGASGEYNFVIQHPSYLTSIKSPDGKEVKFNSSKATQLGYDWLSSSDHVTIFNGYFPNTQWLDVFFNANYMSKLDAVEIGGLKYVFNYNNNPDERLKLENIAIKSNDITVGGTYVFNYNTIKLPVYNAKLSDHWGFFNGVSYSNIDYSQMHLIRVPDTAKMKAEILTKISYPTGGTAGFEYEPHDFSKLAGQFPFVLRDSIGFGGGLRIRRISLKKDNNPINDLVTEYSYKNLDNTSSGILSQQPFYTANGRRHVEYKIKNGGFLWGFSASDNYESIFIINSESMMNSMSNTNGGPVSYSRVLEKRIDNSWTESIYSNFDNVPDEEPVAVLNNIDSKTIGECFTSRQNERGLLLKKNLYNSSGIPVSKTEFQYNDDISRFGDYVKTINKNIFLGASGDPIVRLSANKIYTFYPYLKSETSTSYDINGANPVTNSKKYTYTNFRFVAQEQRNSSNDLKSYISKYTYAADVASGNNAYASLKSRFILNPVVVEEYLFRINGIDSITSAAIHTYEQGDKKFRSEDYIFETKVPVALGNYSSPSFLNGLTYDQRFKLNTKYIYDRYYGNLIGIYTPEGPGQAYIWGYQNSLPIAEIKGQITDSYFVENFEEYTNSITMDAHTGNYAFIGDYPTVNRFAMSPGKSYLLTYFSKTGEVWSYNQVPYTGQTISGILDDIRIYPFAAQISSYTYNPYSEITSKIDDRGQALHYVYNVQQQLHEVKDYKKNIINKSEYHFGAVTPVFYNDEQSINLSRSTGTCPLGFVGAQTVYRVLAGKYAASSLALANALAQQEITSKGQLFADVCGSCLKANTIYAKITYENLTSTSRNDKADVVVRFYSDQALTQPYSVTNLTVNYTSARNGNEDVTSYSKIGSGTSIVLEAQALMVVRDLLDGSILNTWSYSLDPSILYQVL